MEFGATGFKLGTVAKLKARVLLASSMCVCIYIYVHVHIYIYMYNIL